MVYYEEYYGLLRKFMEKNNMKEGEEEMVHKLIQVFSVTNKEVPRKEQAKLYEPETLKIHLMNSIQWYHLGTAIPNYFLISSRLLSKSCWYLTDLTS